MQKLGIVCVTLCVYNYTFCEITLSLQYTAYTVCYYIEGFKSLYSRSRTCRVSCGKKIYTGQKVFTQTSSNTVVDYYHDHHYHHDHHGVDVRHQLYHHLYDHHQCRHFGDHYHE